MRVTVGAALVLFVAALGWSISDGGRVLEPALQATHRPLAVHEDGYASSDTCKACHPSQDQSWRASFHRTMTQLATPDAIRADFEAGPVTVVPGNPIVLERQGDEFWVELGDPDWQGAPAERPRIRRQIVMTTGSHHQQVYWYRTDRTRIVGQLPVTYLIAERRWIPRDAVLLHPHVETPTSETGRWNAVCINCHTTNGTRRVEFGTGAAESDPSVMSADSTVAEFGIACEACHGPGAEHAQANRSPWHRYRQYLTGTPDRSRIVQPAQLTAARSVQVCGQCHGVWEYYGAAGERDANTRGAVFRPGAELRDSRFVVQPSSDRDSPTMRALLEAYPGYVADSFWSDGMVRVSGREYNGLIDSPCFREATDAQHTITCASCHSMHKADDDLRSRTEWADTHQVSSGKDGDLACLQCHAPVGQNVPAHTRHQAGSNGSRCYNCHMPYTTYGLLRAQRSHQISSPSVSATLATGRPNACNACHLDKTLAWTSDTMARWYGTPPVTVSPDEQDVAASLLWLLRGDAGQRAIAAWAMGWAPAQQASGTDWMAVPLAMLLNDPYDAVRFVAQRSLRTLPGFERFDFDFVAPPAERVAATMRVIQQWPGTVAPGRRRSDPALLLDASGAPRMDRIVRLGLQRDDRPVVLRE